MPAVSASLHTTTPQCGDNAARDELEGHSQIQLAGSGLSRARGPCVGVPERLRAAKCWRPAYPALTQIRSVLHHSGSCGIDESDSPTPLPNSGGCRRPNPGTDVAELGLIQYLLLTLAEKQDLVEESRGQR